MLFKDRLKIFRWIYQQHHSKQLSQRKGIVTTKRERTIGEQANPRRNEHKSEPKLPEKSYNETSYYFENGLRKVYPYNFTYTSFVKYPWIGETVLNVHARKFQNHSADVYEQQIRNGTITVNNQKVSPDYILKKNDLLANTVHRHEMPVLNQPIQIIHTDENVVVINKPSSIPVHPIGRYRHNTAVFILAREHGLKDLHPMHRLDRLTSGILLLGRNVRTAQQIEKQMRTRLVHKQYVCRVEGKFPDGCIECNEPIQVISSRSGAVSRVSLKGKDCQTMFEKLSFNGQTSVVLCTPKTGRTHQIRVHLQYLGYPIVNDRRYNDTVFGPLKGRGGDFGGKTDEQLINDIAEIHNAKNWLGTDDVYRNDQAITAQRSNDECASNFDSSKMTTDDNCSECKTIYRDPNPKNLIMYLHAFKYSGPGWSYETPLPEWANENWIGDSE